MFGVFPFGVPYFADPGAEVFTPTPAESHRLRDTFDHWLNGVPVLVPEFDGSFSQWLNGAPDVDQGGQALVTFVGTGIAQANAFLGYKIAAFVSGTGIAASNAFLGHLEAHPASGTGIAQASAQIAHLEAHPASGFGIAQASVQIRATASAQTSGAGISLGSASLTAQTPSLHGQGAGIALASAALSSFPSLFSNGKGIAHASASLSYFVSTVIGPPLPGFPSIQESIPQFITMFGFVLQPVLDVLKFRRVPLNYVSPPVCPSIATQSGSSYQMTPAWL